MGAESQAVYQQSASWSMLQPCTRSELYSPKAHHRLQAAHASQLRELQLRAEVAEQLAARRDAEVAAANDRLQQQAIQVAVSDEEGKLCLTVVCLESPHACGWQRGNDYIKLLLCVVNADAPSCSSSPGQGAAGGTGRQSSSGAAARCCAAGCCCPAGRAGKDGRGAAQCPGGPAGRRCRGAAAGAAGAGRPPRCSAAGGGDSPGRSSQARIRGRGGTGSPGGAACRAAAAAGAHLCRARGPAGRCTAGGSSRAAEGAAAAGSGVG